MLLGHTLGKVDGHLGVDQAPVLPPSGPFFCNIYHSQIQHFQQTIISWKHRFGLGYLAQLAVETLNGIGGIDLRSVSAQRGRGSRWHRLRREPDEPSAARR